MKNLFKRIKMVLAAILVAFGSMPIVIPNVNADGDLGDTVPANQKTITANGDGTYDITIEITGKSSTHTETQKANVVVVLDTSGSMGKNVDTYTYTQNPEGTFGQVGGAYVQLYKKSAFFNVCTSYNIDSSVSEVFSDGSCSNPYAGNRYTRARDTRLSVAKTAVNDLATQLLSKNDANNSDLVEMAFVNFGTTLKTKTSPTTNINTFKGWVNGAEADGGTNWEAALSAANGIDFHDSDKTHIIFVSDGDPTYRDSKYNNNASDYNSRMRVWGNGSSDPNGWNFGAAKNVVDSIKNKEFYTIGAFGDEKRMRELGGTYYSATDQAGLEDAFSKIVNKIESNLTVTKLEITDGITMATAVNGHAGAFRYSGIPTAWGDNWVKASFVDDENGNRKVVWNPGADKTLANGQTISITFTVWPNQNAMDCIAAIENGENENNVVCNESELEKYGLIKNTNGKYSLKTNTEAKFKYCIRTETTVDGSTSYKDECYPETTISENYNGNTELPMQRFDVKKIWHDSMDPSHRKDMGEITLKLFVDEETEARRIYNLNVNDESGNEWGKSGKDYVIAPGVMKKYETWMGDTVETVMVGSEKYAVLEKGHDYRFEETHTGDTDYYALTKKDFHPMIVNDGKIHNVVFNDDGTAVIESVDFKLAAENTLNGRIYISKEVNNNGSIDNTIEDEFEIKVSLTVNSGKYQILTKNGDAETLSEPKEYSDGEFTEKIKVNQQIVLMNVPTGTKYEVSEVLPNGYTGNKVEYVLVKYDGSENENDIKEVFGNAKSTAKVINYLESGNLVISKKVTVLSGNEEKAKAKEFNFTVNVCKVEFKDKCGENAFLTKDFTLGNEETHTIKNVPAGYYYEVKENAMLGFNGNKPTIKTGTIEKGQDEKLEFENKYAVNPEKVEIKAFKDFKFWVDKDEFVFLLTDKDGKSQESTVSFNEVAKFIVDIADEGTYEYRITEKTKDENGLSIFRKGVSRLDGDKDIEVTVKATDKGDGTLGIEIIFKDKKNYISNTYEAVDFDLKTTVVWDDFNDKDSIRPDKVEVELLANGAPAFRTTKTVSAADIGCGAWCVMFNGLPIKDDAGNKINYTVRQVTQVAGYTTAVTGNMTDGFRIVNSHRSTPISPDTGVFTAEAGNGGNNKAVENNMVMFVAMPVVVAMLGMFAIIAKRKEKEAAKVDKKA